MTTEGLSSTRRTEAFSDGVFAIAITLLVLDLKVPDAGRGELLHGLLHQWGAYVAYVTSFLYVGVLWLNHHSAFNRIVAIDRKLHWANLWLLFSAALLPFPTAVLSSALQTGDASDRRVGAVLYALVALSMATSWLALFHRLASRPELVGGHINADVFRRERSRSWIGMGLYAAAAIVALISPVASLVVFFALPVYYAVTSEGVR